MKFILAIVAILALAAPLASAVTLQTALNALCPPLAKQLQGTFYLSLMKAIGNYEIGDFNNPANYDVYLFTEDQLIHPWITDMGYVNGTRRYLWLGENEVLDALKNPASPKHNYAVQLARYFVNNNIGYVPREARGNLGTTAGRDDLFFGAPTTGPTLHRMLQGPFKDGTAKVGEQLQESAIVARNRCVPMNRPVPELLSTRQVVLTMDEPLGQTGYLNAAGVLIQ